MPRERSASLLLTSGPPTAAGGGRRAMLGDWRARNDAFGDQVEAGEFP